MNPVLALKALGRLGLGLLFFLALAIAVAWIFKWAAWLALLTLTGVAVFLMKRELDSPAGDQA